MPFIRIGFLFLLALFLFFWLFPAKRAFSQVKAELVASGLTRPTDFQVGPGDTERFFVLEKAGKIRVVRNGTLESTPFMDISSLVASSGSEQGLLGLAFHPNYASNRFFYVDYTNLSGDTVIARYTASADGSSGQTSTTKTILQIDQPFANHNGGPLVFGPDGYLYIGMGDGGSVGDPDNNAQNLQSLLGKLLRIDVNSGDPYSVPTTNPFVSTSGARGEIWAYGLRNPWRFSFDRSTGDLYIADVGQSTVEEIDAVSASSTGGENYGWRIMEGTSCYNPSSGCSSSGLTLPVHDFTHADGSCSVTGGFVYRGSAIGSLQGHYFYSDFCKNNLSSFRWVGGSATDHNDWTSSLGATLDNVSSFGQDLQGELYVLSYSDGKIYKLIPNPNAVPNLSLKSSLLLLASITAVLGIEKWKLNSTL